MRYLVLALALMAQGALAEDGGPVPGNPGRVLAMIETLPEEVRDAFLASPKRFARAATRVISDYGSPGGIDAQGIGLFIDLTRAEARTDIVAPLMDADLDNDHSITRSEVERLCTTLSSYRKGGLREVFERADADRDATVTADEMMATAELNARERIDPVEELSLRSLPRFDLDGNGRVSQAEVENVAAVAQATAAKASRKKGKAKQSDA